LGAFFGLCGRNASAQANTGTRVSDWHDTHDRAFLGGSFWANPMEDWRVVDGAAESQTGGGFRNIQLLTHELAKAEGSFRMSVRVQRVKKGKIDGGAGFQVGIRADIDDHRAHAFAKNGYRAGIVDDKLLLMRKTIKLPVRAPTWSSSCSKAVQAS
jgi:alkaline phosphatase D